MTTTIDKTKPAISGDDLRARCEALAKEYGAPLPDGDLGLMEAERRLVEYNTKRRALWKETAWDMDTEERIVTPILEPLGDFLHRALVGTVPWGFRGAAVQLRYLTSEREGLMQPGLIPTLEGILDLVRGRAMMEAKEEKLMLDRDPPRESRYLFIACRFESRLNNALVAAGLVHPDQLLSISDKELSWIPNVGPKGRAQIKAWQHHARAIGRQPMPIYRDRTGRIVRDGEAQ